MKLREPEIRKEIKARYTKIKKWTEYVKLSELPKKLVWEYRIAEWLDILDNAIKRHNSKKTWWERVAKRWLRIIECVLIISASFLQKKLPFKF